MFKARWREAVSGIVGLSFEFVSDFGFRISDFRATGRSWAAAGLLSRWALTGVLLVALSVANRAAADDLAQDFLHPPAAARPWVYWFWLNGNITSNGITADLEAMQRVGIGGVLIMEVDQGTPKGPADFGGLRWRGLFQHVCAEAHRLGLEVNMNNDAGWCGSGGPWITPELAMQKVVWSETNVTGPLRFEAELPQPTTVSNYYRDITVLAFPTPQGNARIPDLEGKAAFVPKHLPVLAIPSAGYDRAGSGDPAYKTRRVPSHGVTDDGAFVDTQIPAAETVRLDSIRNLRSCFGENGRLVWDVPPGHWTILRLGHTPTGADNHPAPEPGRGLESDKLSKSATDAMFAGLMEKLISDSRPLAGKTLVSTHIDSWETGSQNWTPRFREDFQRLRRYDPLPYLPVLAGRVVDNVEISERFLWDVRQTVSDLLIANYAGRMRELAHRRGLRLSIEAYDGDPCDDLSYAGQADEPMSEFWSWGYNSAYSCVEMSSAAHVYGKRIVGAEAFTANDQERWQHHPATIKTLGDWAFCEGINRFVFHRYAMQPWLDRAPGMSMGPWGLHYERTETWWNESAAWHEYLARCQYLLRQGLFVADICFLEPEGSPRRFTPTMPWRTGNTPERPRYNFDGCSPEVVLTRMKVKDGRLVLPDGMSYRVLVLPQVETMTPKLLRRIKELVRAGATVIGPPPVASPSLSGYPNCDAEVRNLAAELWTDEPAANNRDRPHVLWGESFKTPSAPAHASPVQTAKWIWYPEGKPASAAPVGERFFRRVLDLSRHPAVASAKVFVTCDNSFQMWINGVEAVSGGDFNELFQADVTKLLKPGTNVIAVSGVNGAERPNPAGLIGVLQVRFADGSALEIKTDGAWQSCRQVPSGWRTAPGTDEAWTTAMELGPFGMPPWGKLDKAAAPPYVFPDFQAITGVLRDLGLPPDFVADPRLRYIHRRDRDTDIYFVANRETNWLQASCGFRVSGKAPEIWDPMTGEISRAAIFTQEAGQTFVQLDFEPAGSRFVIFRKPLAEPVARNSASPLSPSAPLRAVQSDGNLMLPAPGAALSAPPPLEFSATPEGQIIGLAWQSGRYEIQPGSGPPTVLGVPALPAPLEITGPWEVSFPPDRGVPAQATFDRLVDWSQSPDPGIKYFSGTALYRASFTLPDEMLANGTHAFLDLGEVDVMAHVYVNGQDLGTLWKAPFRVDATRALRPGLNRLEVHVVNLWINRMIGDEQLPEDSDRNPNGTLKRWPAWLEAGQPSPTGRYTFTTWRLWKKDSPLQPSGLLGPVRLIPARAIHLGSK